MNNPAANPDEFLAAMADYAALGISTVEIMPMGDPIAYTTQVMENVAPRLAQLLPSPR
jgi:hypothetical protein